MKKIQLYNFKYSENCYKIRLFASLTNIPLEIISLDLASGEHKEKEFLKLNPLGQVPVLVDEPIIIRDSQAILVYLAGTILDEAWWPTSTQGHAEIVQWLSFAANEIEHSFGTSRLVKKFRQPRDYSQALANAYDVLLLFDTHLAKNNWLTMEHPTIADCAVYPYVALSLERNIAIKPYRHICSWIKRIEESPGYSLIF